MTAGLISGAVFAFAIWMIGVPLAAGAHPFWADKVLWIGAPLGLVAFLATLKIRAAIQIVIAVVCAAMAYAAAFQGKAVFAATYAENALAGQVWFIGWIATCAGLTYVVSSATRLFNAR